MGKCKVMEHTLGHIYFTYFYISGPRKGPFGVQKYNMTKCMFHLLYISHYMYVEFPIAGPRCQPRSGLVPCRPLFGLIGPAYAARRHLHL